MKEYLSLQEVLCTLRKSHLTDKEKDTYPQYLQEEILCTGEWSVKLN